MQPATALPLSVAVLCRSRVLACLWIAASILVSGGALAATPLLKLSRSVTVHAAPQIVWARIGRFDQVAAWNPAIAGEKLVAGANDTPGAERVLTLRDGGALTDKLLGYDAKHHRYRYATTSSTLPVRDYTSTLGVKAAGRDRSKVTWSSTFRRKDADASPASSANDATATQAVAAFEQAGLAQLKQIFSAK